MPTDENALLPHFCRQLEDGRIAFYLDNHLLSTFSQCPQSFYYRHIRNLRLKGTEKASGPFQIGIWWSRVLELFYGQMYDYQRKVPDAKEPSLSSLIHNAAQAWNECEMEEFAKANPKAYNAFKGQQGAVLMAENYWATFAELDMRDWNIIAFEQGFGLNNEILVFENAQIVVYWCGRPDLIIYEKGADNLMVVDHKTIDYMKSNFIVKWKPHPQTAGYVYALGILCKTLGFDRVVDRCMINGAARMVAAKPKVVRPRFLRPKPHYTLQEIEEWRRNTGAKAMELFEALKSGYWTWRESSCHVYAGCTYRGIDSIPAGSREAVIKASYVQIEPWKPYKKDEEEDGEGDTE